MAMPLIKRLMVQNSTSPMEITLMVREEYAPILKIIDGDLKIYPFKRSEIKTVKGFAKILQDLRRQNFDEGYLLTPSFSSALLFFLARVQKRKGYAGDLRSFLLTEKVSFPQNVHRAQEFLQLYQEELTDFSLPSFKKPTEKYKLPFQEYIVVNANSEASSRRLPFEKWKELIEKFESKNFVFTGITKERERVASLIAYLEKNISKAKKLRFYSVAGKSSLLDLWSIFYAAELVMTNDSGPAHFAAFLDRPLLGFFGAANLKNTIPLVRRSKFLKVQNANIACSPCLKNICPLKTLECLEVLDMEKAYRDAQDLLKEST